MYIHVYIQIYIKYILATIPRIVLYLSSTPETRYCPVEARPRRLARVRVDDTWQTTGLRDSGSTRPSFLVRASPGSAHTPSSSSHSSRVDSVQHE